MRFDYLHSPRPLLLERVSEVRVPERMQTALFAVTAALAVTAGAWSIQAYRLREVLQIETGYRARHLAAQAALERVNVRYKEVRALAALDGRVRSIAASGDADARALAEIANRLPAHAWLTGISHDGTGLALEGRARDLFVLGEVMNGLSRGRHVRRPRLVSASLETEPGAGAVMRYHIHVEAGAP